MLEQKRYSGCTVLVRPVVSVSLLLYVLVVHYATKLVLCNETKLVVASFILQLKYLDPQYEKARVRYPFKSISNVDSLEIFVHQKSVPLVGEMAPQNEQLYHNTNLPVVTVFTRIDHSNQKSEQHSQDLMKQVRAVAVKFKKFNFNIADAKTYLKDMHQKYNLESAHAYTEQHISVGMREGSVYYAMPQGEFTVEKLKQFVLDFIAGRIEGVEQVMVWY